MPDYNRLLESVGVSFDQANPERATLGTPVAIENGRGILQSNAIVGSPLYEAGIEQGDEILSIGGRSLRSAGSINELMSGFNPGQSSEIVFERWSEEKAVQVVLRADPVISTNINPNADAEATAQRKKWLESE